MIYRYRGAHFHNLTEENDKMTYWDACDCGCQDFRGEIHEGDTIVSTHGLGPSLSGNIKNITIVATKLRFRLPCTLENTHIIYKPYEEINQLYPK